jgi:branched-chain amino acid transport system substrate-binding protein
MAIRSKDTMEFRAKRRDVLRAATATAVAGLSGFPGLVLGQSSPQTVKIGGIWPMTGILSYSGMQAQNGARIAADEINANGGIKSLGGAKIELVVGDSQSKPEVAVAEVDKLTEQGIVCFLGSCASGIALTATQASARNKVPFMVDGSVSDQIVQRGLYGVFRFSPGFKRITDVSLDNLVKINESAGKPAKTVILVYEDGAFGSGLAKTLAGELPKRGFEVLDMIAHPTPTRDFTNIGLRLRSAKPDLIIPSSYLNEYTLLARSIHQHKVPMKAIYSVIGGGASNMKFVREYNAAAQNIMDCNHWVDPKKPKTQALFKVLDKNKIDLTWEVILQHSGVLLIADAIERAGSADRDKVTQALTASTFEGHVMPYGPTKFVNGQNEGAQPINTQVQKNSIEVVFPPQYATGKPVYPIPRT